MATNTGETTKVVLGRLVTLPGRPPKWCTRSQLADGRRRAAGCRCLRGSPLSDQPEAVTQVPHQRPAALSSDDTPQAASLRPVDRWTPLRILFAIKSLHVEGGGAERLLVQVANGVAARGHEVAILTFDRPGQELFYEVADDVLPVGLGLGVVGRSTPRMTLLRALPILRAAVRRRSPDVAAGFMHSMYVPLGAALVGSGVPVVASEH